MQWGRAVVAVVLACAASAGEQAFGLQADGRPLLELAPASAKAVVLYFVASDCPVSNRTLPEMLRVQHEFAARDVAFWFVYPNTGETLQTMTHHLAAFGVGKDAVLDKASRLVALTHARVTPEAAVLVRDGAAWKPVYTGRIDDRYVRLGVERPQATEHFIEQVVSEVLGQRPVQKAVGTPVGCAIMNPSAPVQTSEDAKQ
ncbi:redoxin domain-containing protein [Granulicella paludicola]|uniref:redoxin domain-containing protein n=1 Tax=Granulicella paludicola TaxID=474951 RepID=UPI0021E0419F|nr:redoxin domain-containing protein [Granulicella paludicola]